MVLVTTLVAAASPALAVKRADIAGYRFEQITDNAAQDIEPRVSASGLVVWSGRYGLPGSSSTGDDQEIFFWDGVQVQQVTDDDAEDVRPVVNSAGDLAWQKGGNSPRAEIWIRVAGAIRALTQDPLAFTDRYPDINERGAIVWGRLNATRTDYELAVHDPDLGPDYRVFSGRAYRPHLNSQDHVEFAGGGGIYDLDRQLLTPFPLLSDIGYRAYRRSELNALDQVAFEAEPEGPGNADFEGPRDILLWDGSAMRLIRASTGWQGRPDLNAAGLIVWEAYGGLPGSLSGGSDREIFLYDPTLDTVAQLTDDDVEDWWPTVTQDGRIVWHGWDGYPGARSSDADSEIFIATPYPGPTPPLVVAGYAFAAGERAFADDALLVSGGVRADCTAGAGIVPASSLAEALTGSDVLQCVEVEAGGSGELELRFRDNAARNGLGPDLVIFELSEPSPAGTFETREPFGISVFDGQAFGPFQPAIPAATGVNACGDPSQCLDVFAVEVDLSDFGILVGNSVERVRIELADPGAGAGSAEIAALGALHAPMVADADTDGRPDWTDNCPHDPNPDQTDTDGDGIGDVCDACVAFDDRIDSDGDGAPDGCDVCPQDADNDLDADGVCSPEDNCIEEANADQADFDADGVGDVCDPRTSDPLDLADATPRTVTVALDAAADPALVHGLMRRAFEGSWSVAGNTGTLTVPAVRLEAFLDRHGEAFSGIPGATPVPGSFTDLVLEIDIATQAVRSLRASGQLLVPSIGPVSITQDLSSETAAGFALGPALGQTLALFCEPGPLSCTEVPGEAYDPIAGLVNAVGLLQPSGEAPLFAPGGDLRLSELDPDQDGLPSVYDNCPFAPNPAQQDRGGLTDAPPDGVGDVCQCGDVDDDGRVQINDATLMKRAVLGLPPGLAAPLKCSVIGTPNPDDADADGLPDDCAINDATVIKRALLGLGPGIAPVCSPAVP